MEKLAKPSPISLSLDHLVHFNPPHFINNIAVSRRDFAYTEKVPPRKVTYLTFGLEPRKT